MRTTAGASFAVICSAWVAALPVEGQPLQKEELKRELLRSFERCLDGFDPKEVRRLADLGDVFEVTVEVLREAEVRITQETERESIEHLLGRIGDCMFVLSHTDDARVRAVMLGYLRVPQGRILGGRSYGDIRPSYSMSYFLKRHDPEGESIIQGFLTDPSLSTVDKEVVIGRIGSMGDPPHWLPILKGTDWDPELKEKYGFAIKDSIETLELRRKDPTAWEVSNVLTHRPQPPPKPLTAEEREALLLERRSLVRHAKGWTPIDGENETRPVPEPPVAPDAPPVPAPTSEPARPSFYPWGAAIGGSVIAVALLAFALARRGRRRGV